MERVRNMAIQLPENRPASPATTTSASAGREAQASPHRRASSDAGQSVHSSAGTASLKSQELEYQPLHYHHAELEQQASGVSSGASGSGVGVVGGGPRYSSSTSDLSFAQTDSQSGRSVTHRATTAHRFQDTFRPKSLVNLLNSSYPQAPPGTSADGLPHPAPGAFASSLGHKKTFDMYLANVKKTNDPTVQYEFAIFMINSSMTREDDAEEDAAAASADRHKSGKKNKGNDSSVSKYELIREAKHILQRLADKGFPFAQYHLGDGYASGFFNKGKPDHPRAFSLFVAASKHGHVESGYRAALCYEFGWGTNKDKAKAVQFYRQAAAKGHPGAMLRMAKACLHGDMGQINRSREGITWLKRAAEAADRQYNSAPYELGILHEQGFGDDVFKDPSYAAQLFTRAAELGNADAAFRMGDAYEHGRLHCPVDPALSIHFYTTAAQMGHGPAMMALSAWYMLGSEGLLDRDYYEAFEWAKRAAETGLPKACFAVGYFTEAGIGCRRDPLEANIWYVRAAEAGDERARTRLAAIQKASHHSPDKGSSAASSSTKDDKPKGKRFGLF
ncbi:hypothetical protein KEM52_000708 [Ascosphaera acerosa]|nr:hypothetical protein KEM52_000708 [Ascosphaera acerosa]